MEPCFWWSCFALDPEAPKFFGFSEFLAGMALMILAWTTTDARYRFRVSVAILPLQRLTYFSVVIVGCLTLLTDLWRANGWLVPYIAIGITPEVWQALLGLSFLLIFLTWAWFAYIRPSEFGRLNAERFTESLQHFFLNAPITDQAIIAQELKRSAVALITHATGIKTHQLTDDSTAANKTEICANTVLMLIANKVFCRNLISNASGTAYNFFYAIDTLKKYDLFGFEIFARNVVNEALRNKDSFLYHEESSYESGFMGFEKKFTTMMFANYKMVSGIETLLEPDDVCEKGKLDSVQWRIYCGLVITAIEGCIKAGNQNNTPVLVKAINNIRNAFFDVHTLDAETSSLSDVSARLECVTYFIGQVHGMISCCELPSESLKKMYTDPNSSIDLAVAKLADYLIFEVSRIQGPLDHCRTLQAKVWDKVIHGSMNRNSRLMNAKMCRLIYKRIRNIYSSSSPDCRVLGFFLNVLGLKYKYTGPDYRRSQRMLHRAVLAWTSKHYLTLYRRNPAINDYLCEGMYLDVENSMLVKVFPANKLNAFSRCETLELKPALLH